MGRQVGWGVNIQPGANTPVGSRQSHDALQAPSGAGIAPGKEKPTLRLEHGSCDRVETSMCRFLFFCYPLPFFPSASRQRHSVNTFTLMNYPIIHSI